MNLEIWHIWIIISIILFIIEVFTPTFLAICLAIGCFASAFMAHLGFDIKIQLLAFSIGTFISLFTIRPLMLKYAHKNSKEVKTNMDALVGRTGRVVVVIDNKQNQGRIIVDGDNWRAESENNNIINEGEKVEIIKVNSTTLIIKQITKI